MLPRKRVYLCLLLSILLIGALLTGCAAWNPVKGIAVKKALSTGKPPRGPFSELNDPNPDVIQAIFHQGEQLLVILSINKNIENTVTFSRYTYVNIATRLETEIHSTKEPWYPGQVGIINLDNPWDVPDKPGEYEMRVYLEDSVVASARFRVE